MKATLQVNPKLSIEVEAPTQTELFESLAANSEIFAVCKCGQCGGDNIQFVVREVEVKKKPVKYYELRCQKAGCYAKFHYGVMEGGKLFPIEFKRKGGEYLKDNNGKNIPWGMNGWTKYNKETGQEE